MTKTWQVIEFDKKLSSLLREWNAEERKAAQRRVCACLGECAGCGFHRCHGCMCGVLNEMGEYHQSLLDQRTQEIERAVKWLYNRSKPGPFQALGSPMEMEWHCWGCEGVFLSKYPTWEEPTLKSFKHRKKCEYINSLRVLNLLP